MERWKVLLLGEALHHFIIGPHPAISVQNGRLISSCLVQANDYYLVLRKCLNGGLQGSFPTLWLAVGVQRARAFSTVASLYISQRRSWTFKVERKRNDPFMLFNSPSKPDDLDEDTTPLYRGRKHNFNLSPTPLNALVQ